VPRWSAGRARERALVWLWIVMAVTAAEVVAAHWVVAVPYPAGRTGLYWMPMFALAGILAFARVRTHPICRGLGWLTIVLVLAADVLRFQTTTFADWSYDAPGRAIISRLTADHEKTGTPVSLGGSWQVEPAMNFYRVTRGLDWMAPIERRPPTPGDDYYVFMKADAGIAADLGLRTLMEDPGSGTMLAVPRGRP